ncbi:MAG: dihydropteroate synthase [Opitutae bacterium]|nr:dihydropteroate synthase [Opitutae bacterium]
MGILNLTPDSFSDGGSFVDPEVALEHALSMVEEGAQIIDLGGESTRPGSAPVSEQEELARVLPTLEKLPVDQFVLSIDTTKPAVAQAALQAGAHVINDVSGGNPELLDLAQRYQAGFVLMHAQGCPKNMQDKPEYDDVVGEIRAFFDEKKSDLIERGLPRIWIDPGIGFGKSLEHNLDLMGNLSAFKDQAWGILVGSSRKSWIDALCDAPDPSDRLGGSIASALCSLSHGTEIIRAHDVKETAQALQVAKELALSPHSPYKD